MSKVFIARFPGKCERCGEEVQGKEVAWDRNAGKSRQWHIACKDKPAPSENGAGTEINQAALAFEKALELLKAPPVIDENAIRELVQEEIENRIPQKLLIENQKTGTLEKLDLFHENLPTLLKLIETRNPHGCRMNVYIHGQAGSGKSAATSQAAKALGLAFGYQSLNPMTPDSRCLGYMHAGGDYVGTEFFKLYTNGGVFCFDEIDNASASFVTTLNSALENGHGAFPHGVYARHPDFVCVCTANTIGRGGDINYPERRALDGAFLDRFVFLEWGYDEKLTRAIVSGIIGGEKTDSLISWVDKKSADLKNKFPELIVSPRAYIQSAIMESQGFPKSLIESACIARGLK